MNFVGNPAKGRLSDGGPALVFSKLVNIAASLPGSHAPEHLNERSR